MRFGLCEFVDCPIKGKLPSWHIRKNDNRKLLDWCEVRRQQEAFSRRLRYRPRGQKFFSRRGLANDARRAGRSPDGPIMRASRFSEGYLWCW